MCTPPSPPHKKKKKEKEKEKERHCHALPLIAQPPLENTSTWDFESFTSFKLYMIPLLFKPQSISEEVRRVKVRVLYCLKWVHPWPVLQWKPFFVLHEHIHRTLFVTIDMDRSACSFARNCPITSKVQEADQFVRGKKKYEKLQQQKNWPPPPSTISFHIPFRPLIQGWCCLKCHCQSTPFAVYLVSRVVGYVQSPAARCSQSRQSDKFHSHLLHPHFNHAHQSCPKLWLNAD